MSCILVKFWILWLLWTHATPWALLGPLAPQPPPQPPVSVASCDLQGSATMWTMQFVVYWICCFYLVWFFCDIAYTIIGLIIILSPFCSKLGIWSQSGELRWPWLHIFSWIYILLSMRLFTCWGYVPSTKFAYGRLSSLLCGQVYFYNYAHIYCNSLFILMHLWTWSYVIGRVIGLLGNSCQQLHVLFQKIR